MTLPIIHPINQQFIMIQSLDDFNLFRNQLVEFYAEGAFESFKGVNTLFYSQTRYAYIGPNIIQTPEDGIAYDFKILSDIKNPQARQHLTTKNFPHKLYLRLLNVFEVEEVKKLLNAKEAQFDIDPDDERYLSHAIEVDMKRLRCFRHFSDYPDYFKISDHFFKLPERNKVLAHIEHMLDHDSLPLVALVGITGSGKSALAHQYMNSRRSKYFFRACFNAENKSTLHKDYMELAEQHAIPYPKDDSIENQLFFVKRWLENQVECLYVYDNLMDEELKDYIPNGKNHVLLISRNQHILSGSRIIKIDELNNADAIALVTELVPNTKELELQQLVSKLGSLPLVLVQAATYNAKHYERWESYLTKLENPKWLPKLLTYDHFYSGQDHTPVWNAFDTNLKSIQSQSPLAWLILKQMSQCEVNWISRNQLTSFGLKEHTSMLDVNDAIGILNEYSFLIFNQDNNQIKMNPILKLVLLHKQDLLDNDEYPKEIVQEVDTAVNHCNHFFSQPCLENCPPKNEPISKTGANPPYLNRYA